MGVGDPGKWGHGLPALWQGKAGLEEVPGEGGVGRDFQGRPGLSELAVFPGSRYCSAHLGVTQVTETAMDGQSGRP